MTREIPLSRGHVAIVDDEDYERVATKRWYSVGRPPRATSSITVDGKQRSVPLGRFILNPPPDRYVDHINGDPLNNTRANLRICTNAENLRNRRKHKNGRHPYKGIAQVRQRWFAAISYEGVRHYRCGFATAEEAARAYDGMARHYHGEFARLNFPDDVPANPIAGLAA